MKISPKNLFTEHRFLILIATIGLTLRVWHVGWGLPELYEEAAPLTVSWKFWNFGHSGFQFNPHFFNYPALTFYLQFGVQLVHYLLGYIVGIYADLNSFGTTLASVVIPARLLDALFDVGSIVLVYQLALEISERRVALLAAALVALNPLHIQEAHFIQVDTALTFFGLLSLLFVVRVLTWGEAKWYYFAAISIGLAAASKYTGVFLLVTLIAAHLMRAQSLRNALLSLKDTTLGKSLLVAAATFLIANPYIIISFDEFQRDFSFEQSHVSYGHLGINPSQSTIGYYFLDAIPSSIGWILVLIVFATAVGFFVRKDKRELLLLVFPAVFVFVLSTWRMRAERYVFPIVPILLLIGAIGVIRFWDWIMENYSRSERGPILKSKFAETGALFVVGLVVAFQPLLRGVNYLQSLGLPDTRQITKQWIQQNLPAGSSIATGPYGIDFSDTTYSIVHIPFLAFQSELVAPFYDTRWYEDVDLLITSDYDYARYAQEPEKYRDILAYYDSLRTGWNMVFASVPSEYQIGPSYWLFTLPDSLRHATFDPSVFAKLAANPESARVSNFLKELNTVCLQKGRLEKSEQIMREILSVEVENTPLRNQLAHVLFQEGKYAAALRQLQISVEQNKNQAGTFALAGSALLRLGREREAEPTLQKALELDPYSQSAYEDLIKLYETQHDKTKLLTVLMNYNRILPHESDRAKEIQQQIRKLRGR